MLKGKTLIIAIYSHIEAYPPSLNALQHLSGLFGKIVVLVPNNMKSQWKYPVNVDLNLFGPFEAVEMAKHKSMFQKIKGYVAFGMSLRRLIRKHNPDMVATFDPSSFSMAVAMSGDLLRRNNVPVWYHNHDVVDEKELPRFSLMRLSRQLEQKYFRRIKFFSLPNSVRLKYFPVDRLENAPVIIPNYPSKLLFGSHYRPQRITDKIKLIYQGQISQSTVPEVFVRLLRFFPEEKPVELHLAGPAVPDHLARLKTIAVNEGLEDRLYYHGLLPYGELPDLTATCNIGLAVYGDYNTMVRTMSTASNKIFEYASLGLPVIMNNRPDMVEEFKSYRWIQFCNLEESALVEAINSILVNYSEFHTRARLDFEEKLNFEVAFVPFMQKIQREVEH